MLTIKETINKEFNNSTKGGTEMLKEQLQKYNIEKLYYMTHINNVPSILEKGILCYNQTRFISHASICDYHVQLRRDMRFIEEYRTIHDYVPLYFATHTPMQYVITHHKDCSYYINEVFLAFIEVDPIKVFQTRGVVFTDGNSACRETSFYKDIHDLEKIDWNIIKKKKCISREYKRKKSAEVLIPDSVPVDYFSGVVFFEQVKKEILNRCSKASRERLTKLCRMDMSYYVF